jgi:hypothetical protein
MKHIRPEKMSRPVRKLWEISLVKSLSPEALAPIVGVSFMTIYRWFQGTEPLAAHEGLIAKAIEKLEPTLPQPGTAWWGKDDPDDPSEIADRARCEAIKPLFAELMKVAPDNVRPIVEKGWPDFAELLALAMKYGIKLPTK